MGMQTSRLGSWLLLGVCLWSLLPSLSASQDLASQLSVLPARVVPRWRAWLRGACPPAPAAGGEKRAVNFLSAAAALIEVAAMSHHAAHKRRNSRHYHQVCHP